jgi:hypothetical protein
MKDVDRILRQISKIREVAAGEALPYVGRSRVGRLVFVLNELVADDKPDAITNVGRRIQDVAKAVCQPSEPLDTRWRRGWSDLLLELDRLESLLAGDRALFDAEQSALPAAHKDAHG